MSTTGKNKGGQKAWTTEEQKAWLASLIPDYLVSRSSNAPGEFWPGLFEDWLRMWPLGKADAKEKEAGDTDQDWLKRLKMVSQCASEEQSTYQALQRIKDWFKNHTPVSAASLDGGRRKLLTFRPKTKKKLQEVHVYMKLFFKSRVKGQINERWRQTYLKKNPNHDPDQPIPAMRLADRNRVITRIYKEETQEVRDAVEAEKAIMDAQLELEQDGDSSDAQPEAAAGNANDDADDAESKRKRENDKKNWAYNECVCLSSSSTPPSP